MKNIWSKDRKAYELSEGFQLKKADWKVFSIYFAVYEIYSENLWFRKSFEESTAVLEECDECFWITKEGKKIGGVLLKPNYMNCLFLIPPFREYEKFIEMLKEILLDWSMPRDRIIVGGSKREMKEYFLNQGFTEGISRRCMIKPTEVYDLIWNEDILITSVIEDKTEEICSLFNESYVLSDSNGETDYEKSLKRYFEITRNNAAAIEASTLLYDRETNELIGACLISIWEEWPNIYDIAVKSSYQKKGLAKNMIRRASTVLKNHYPVLRLFVTLGNEAEKVYDSIGFLSGAEWTEMYIEK